MKKLAVILIIAHKDILTKNEESSFIQCHKIFRNHPIKIICPENLNVTIYKKLVPGSQVEFIDPVWLSNYGMFNLLKVNELLYKKYSTYKFVLFYELDAWVFRDDLEYWCNKNFDYIGAPWFEGGYRGESTHIIGVGNGGFSLRNIQSCLRLIKRIKMLRHIRTFWFKSYLQSLIPFNKLMSFCKNIFKIDSSNALNNLLIDQEIIEDIFWCTRIGKVFKDFNVADIENAKRFSFEVNPQLLYNLSNNQLPFGCHAWEKCDPDFWKTYIQTEPVN